MPELPSIQIVSDGAYPSTRVIYRGLDISACVREVVWRCAVQEMATATVVFDLTKIEALTGEVTFTGLDGVPLDALEQEIDRRTRQDEESDDG